MQIDDEHASENTIEIFCLGAQAVAEAVRSPAVEAAWFDASTLEAQTIGMLAAHVARGGIWVAADYVEAEIARYNGNDGSPALTPTINSGADYFAHLADVLDAGAHAAIRERSMKGAAQGYDGLLERVEQRLGPTLAAVRSLRPDHPITVIGGLVMRLSDYLDTRIVEQVVHLDDLARSLSMTRSHAEAEALIALVPNICRQRTLAIAVEIARIRHGDSALIHALYRGDPGSAVFPIL